MFLNLDQKNRQRVAVIDDSDQSITYGTICDFSTEFAKHLPQRSLIFILSENSIGSLLGYTSCLINKIVPLIISAKTEESLYTNLRDQYHPAYLWTPDDMVAQLGYEPIFSAWGYTLVKTGFPPIELYDELSLLLPTSGSTGSPKLVRHSYRNIEANADNVKRESNGYTAHALHHGVVCDCLSFIGRCYTSAIW